MHDMFVRSWTLEEVLQIGPHVCAGVVRAVKAAQAQLVQQGSVLVVVDTTAVPA